MTNAAWYLGRGTGLVSLILLTVVVALGIATRSGRPAFGLPRFAVSAVHRNASLLSVVFLTIHVTTLLVDPYAQLRLVDVVLPFVGAYRPVWQGLGTLALDLVVALVVTSLLRHRIGVRTWRAVHWLAYAAWPAALLHGLGNGTDAGQLWLRGTAAVCTAVVLAALAWRGSATFAERSRKLSSDERRLTGPAQVPAHEDRRLAGPAQVPAHDDRRLAGPAQVPARVDGVR